MSTGRKNNVVFIVCTIIVSLTTIFILIERLNKTEATIPNWTTIIGSVITIAALVFTIKEQLRLKGISEALIINNKKIQNQLSSYSIGSNLNKCLKYVHDIKHYTQDKKGLAVLIRLTDLKQCLIDCNKINNNDVASSSSKCIEELLKKSDKDLTVNAIKSLIDNVTLQETTERQKALNTYIELVSDYIIAIELANRSLNGIKDSVGFISQMEDLESYLNKITDSPIFKIENDK